MNLHWGRRVLYIAAGAAILLLACWLRNPLIPYGGGTPGASGISESEARSAEGARALTKAVTEEHRRLANLAASALRAPREVEAAFEFLKNTSPASESGVIVFENSQPFAWTGQFRNTPLFTGEGTSVLFTPFYVTLQVAVAAGSRSAIASTLLHAEPPADRVATGLDERLPQRRLTRRLYVPGTE